MVGSTTTLDHSPTPPTVDSISAAVSRRQAVPPSSSAVVVVAFISEMPSGQKGMVAELPERASARNPYIVPVRRSDVRENRLIRSFDRSLATSSRIERQMFGVGERLAGQAQQKSPVADDCHLAPVLPCGGAVLEQAGALEHLGLCLVERRPPGFLQMVELEGGPA